MVRPLPLNLWSALLTCTLLSTACSPNMQHAAVAWKPVRSQGVCPREARVLVDTRTQTRCVDRTNHTQEPCEHIDTIARLWEQKVGETFAQVGCPNARSKLPGLPTLTVSLEEIRFDGGHDRSKLVWLFAALLIPGYVYMATDQERAITARVHATLQDTQGAVLWEATLYHQERTEGSLNEAWTLSDRSPDDKPLFNEPISNLLSHLLQKTLNTTRNLNTALRTGEEP